MQSVVGEAMVPEAILEKLEPMKAVAASPQLSERKKPTQDDSFGKGFREHTITC